MLFSYWSQKESAYDFPMKSTDKLKERLRKIRTESYEVFKPPVSCHTILHGYAAKATDEKRNSHKFNTLHISRKLPAVNVNRFFSFVHGLKDVKI